jgi:hypothetical protein
LLNKASSTPGRRSSLRKSHVLNRKYDKSDPIIREIMADTSQQTCPDFMISNIMRTEDCESDSDSDVSSIGDSDDSDFMFLSFPPQTPRSTRILAPINQNIAILSNNRNAPSTHKGFSLQPQIKPLSSTIQQRKRNKPFCIQQKGEILGNLITPTKSCNVRKLKYTDIHISY